MLGSVDIVWFQVKKVEILQLIWECFCETSFYFRMFSDRCLVCLSMWVKQCVFEKKIGYISRYGIPNTTLATNQPPAERPCPQLQSKTSRTLAPDTRSLGIFVMGTQWRKQVALLLLVLHCVTCLGDTVTP